MLLLLLVLELVVVVVVELVARPGDEPRESSSSSWGGRGDGKLAFAALTGKRDTRGTENSSRIRHSLRWQRTRAIPFAVGGGAGVVVEVVVVGPVVVVAQPVEELL